MLQSSFVHPNGLIELPANISRSCHFPLECQALLRIFRQPIKKDEWDSSPCCMFSGILAISSPPKSPCNSSERTTNCENRRNFWKSHRDVMGSCFAIGGKESIAMEIYVKEQAWEMMCLMWSRDQVGKCPVKRCADVPLWIRDGGTVRSSSLWPEMRSDCMRIAMCNKKQAKAVTGPEWM